MAVGLLQFNVMLLAKVNDQHISRLNEINSSEITRNTPMIRDNVTEIKLFHTTSHGLNSSVTYFSILNGVL